jgi:hypothetical protein
MPHSVNYKQRYLSRIYYVCLHTKILHKKRIQQIYSIAKDDNDDDEHNSV